MAGRIWQLLATGGEGDPLTDEPNVRQGALSWSPDGRSLLFQRTFLQQLATAGVWLLDVQTGEERLLAEQGAVAGLAAVTSLVMPVTMSLPCARHRHARVRRRHPSCPPPSAGIHPLRQKPDRLPSGLGVTRMCQLGSRVHLSDEMGRVRRDSSRNMTRVMVSRRQVW